MNERILSRKTSIAIAVALFVGFFGFIAWPRVADNPSLRFAFLGWGGGLAAWAAWLIRRARAEGRTLEVQVWLRKPHYIQTAVQFLVYGYWAANWPTVVEYLPLLAAQIVFGYLFDMCLSWSRYGRFRLGFGQWPVTFSTNLFIWFSDDLFGFQFLMLALAYGSREFIKWERDGRRVHIFNPSGFGLAAVAVVLIAGGWSHHTFGAQIAQTLGNGVWCFEIVFIAGFVVQAFFPIVLVTLAAAVTTFALDAAFLQVTGVYHYVDTAIPIAVFIGMTLLVTDPVSSPRTNTGRVLFGVLYGVSVFVFYDLLGLLETPGSLTQPAVSVTWYDKLLFLPILNLLARPLDRIGDRLEWKGWSKSPAVTNALHLGLWVLAFLAMRPQLSDHPGRDPGFWSDACAADRYRACENLLFIYENHCLRDLPEACHNLGDLLERGAPGIPIDLNWAAGAYKRACDLGLAKSCTYFGVMLVNGTGVAKSEPAGLTAFERGCRGGDPRGCGLGGTLLLIAKRPADALPMFTRGCDGDDALSCAHLATMHGRGDGVPRDEAKARALQAKACRLGMEAACRM